MAIDYSPLFNRQFIPDPSFTAVQDISSALGSRAREDMARKQSIQDEIELLTAKANLEAAIAAADPVAQQIKQGQLADAQKKIYEAGGPQPTMFGGGVPQSTAVSPNGFGQFQSPSTNEIPEWVPSGFDQFGRPKGYERNPDLEAKRKKEGEIAVKKADAKKDLENYLVIDDMVQKMRGKGTGRFKAGANIKFQALKQDTAEGRAASTLGKSRKNLRVTIARLKDVGNLSATEQSAAEALIPGDFDDQQTAELKRAYLRDLATAVGQGESEVKAVLQRWQQEDLYKNKYGLPENINNKSNKTGGTLMIDASGNKAMVYPDGSFEEVR